MNHYQIRQGDTYVVPYEYKVSTAEGAEPVDLTGYTFAAELLKKNSGAAYPLTVTNPEPLTGVIFLDLGDTSAIDLGLYEIVISQTFEGKTSTFFSEDRFKKYDELRVLP